MKTIVTMKTMIDIYIRPLEEKDAYVSVLWRNNPEIWKFTGSKPDIEITIEIELSWIKNAIKRSHEKRFAICLTSNNRYIGNVQLTDITEIDAQFHIFIGEPEFWNKGICTKATKLIIEYGFQSLALSSIYLYVNENNKPAIKSYLNNGFEVLNLDDFKFKMVLIKPKK